MTPHRLSFHAALCLIAATGAILCGGCASHEPLARYFVLTSDAAAGGAGPAGGGVRVFIRRVDIPGYLQTTKLASRRAENQVQYSTQELWAEPLSDGIAQAVGSAMDRSSRVTVAGVIGGGIPPARDYDLKIDIGRFEGDDHGEVVLVATWSLFAPESATPLLTRRSRFAQSGWKYGDYPGMARLLGLDLGELGAEIARSVRSQP